MQEKGMVSASENWRADGGLPLPAQFLQESGRLMAKQGKAIRFRLISNWAINKEHRPMTEFERTGLLKIIENPDRPYTAVTTEGKTRIFQALYPDKAVSQHCADCHNVHPKSLKRDFKAGDVMGGMLVTIALSQEGKTN
jgi:formate-dependent nitrite reductase cytochrome c552 subunit